MKKAELRKRLGLTVLQGMFTTEKKTLQFKQPRQKLTE